jgi:glycosyltransferase involved in cell wall biosynthesis
MSERQRRSIGPRSDHVIVVHNAITNFERDNRGADSARIAELCTSLARPRIGVIGRLSPEKGVDIFLDACVRLRQQNVEFNAIIAGDGPDRSALERQAGLLAPNVVFAGHVEDVAALYENIDLLVIPSRSEGLPNVLLEAIGHDLPVVSTDVGAIAEVLADPVAGLIVPAGDSAALAAAIGKGITPDYSLAGLDARRRIADRFSLQTRTRRIADLIREIARTPSI